MLNETWKEQYDRMKRSFELLKQLGEPTLLPQYVIPLDVLYHFCCDVYHLRDWIAADVGTDRNSRERTKTKLNKQVIRPSRELSACRDIANGSKHLKLDYESFVTGISQSIDINITDLIGITDAATFSPSDADGSRIDAAPVAPPPLPAPTPASRTFMIDIGGQQHDAQDVATKAVAAWDRWLAGPSTIAVQLRQPQT